MLSEELEKKRRREEVSSLDDDEEPIIFIVIKDGKVVREKLKEGSKDERK